MQVPEAIGYNDVLGVGDWRSMYRVFWRASGHRTTCFTRALLQAGAGFRVPEANYNDVLRAERPCYAHSETNGLR